MFTQLVKEIVGSVGFYTCSKWDIQTDVIKTATLCMTEGKDHRHILVQGEWACGTKFKQLFENRDCYLCLHQALYYLGQR